MDESPAQDPLCDPAAVAAYVAQLAGELAHLARGSGLTTLAYILEMAQMEARGAAVARHGFSAHREDTASDPS